MARATRTLPPSIEVPDSDLPPRPSTQQHRPNRPHRARRWVIGITIVVVTFLAVGLWLVYRAIASVNTVQTDGSNKKTGIIEQIGKIITSGQQELKGESDGRVNILLLGIGGPGHDGPYLTDTMVVMSYDVKSKQVSMISIPRDLVVSIPNQGYRKINSVLSVGRDQKYVGGGEALTVKVVSDLLNLNIQYYVRVDFSGFEKVIDLVGGVDITVDQTFADYSYPTSNYGYQTIRFTKGPMHMNGATALKYARSRHGNNGEGSDFARSKRQQKIINGLKEKILSLGTLSNPKKITEIMDTLGSHSQTNMEVWELLRMSSLAKDVDTGHIINKVIQDGPDGLVHSARGLGGAFILVPNDNTYAYMRFLAQHVFELGAADAEGTNIVVVNSAKKASIATGYMQALRGFGFHATLASSTTWKGGVVAETTIIDANANQNPLTIATIQALTHSTKVSTPSVWSEETSTTNLYTLLESLAKKTPKTPPHLLLLLGTDQTTTAGSVKIPTTTTSATTTKTTTNTTKTNTNTSVPATNTSISANTNSSTNTNTSTTNSSQ
jgi:LCP family protein required for cell wall assembly